MVFIPCSRWTAASQRRRTEVDPIRWTVYGSFEERVYCHEGGPCPVRLAVVSACTSSGRIDKSEGGGTPFAEPEGRLSRLSTWKVDICGSPVVQRLVKACRVLKRKVGVQSLVQFSTCRVAFYVNIFIFHTAPQTFDEHVVDGSASAIHADRHACLF